MEIAPHVHSIPVATGAFMGTFSPNVYLVMGQQGAFIDSGYERDAALRVEYVRNLGVTLAYVIVTHPHIDHIGGATGIKERTGAKIAMHSLATTAAERYLTPAKIDQLLSDGEVLELGDAHLEAIHTPGHNPGHLCIYLRDSRVLFSGDNILGTGTTAISPSQGNMAQYIVSLKKLLDYEIDLICPGHGPLIRQPRRKIEELIEHRLEREQQVLAYVKRGKATVEELVQEIYPELDSRLYPAAKGQVLAHLQKLEGEGRIASVEAGEGCSYFVTQ